MSKILVFNPKRSVKIFAGEEQPSFPEFLEIMKNSKKGIKTKKKFIYDDNHGDRWYAMFAASPSNREVGVLTVLKEGAVDDSMNILIQEFGEDFFFDCRPKLIDSDKISNLEDFILKVSVSNDKKVEVNRRWLTTDVDNDDEDYLKGISVVELTSDISKYL